MMRWKPVTREKLAEILRDEVYSLTPEAKTLYEYFKQPLSEFPCFRDSSYGGERVFVVARAGKALLIFDDVEEDFALGIPDVDGVLRSWNSYGPLVAAVLALAQGTPTPSA